MSAAVCGIQVVTAIIIALKLCASRAFFYGEEREMKELPKVYDPKSVEKKVYEMWMDGHYFEGKIDPIRSPSPSLCRPQCHRSAPHGACPRCDASGYPDPL